MKRFFQYFGFVAFISLLVYGASFLYEQFPKIVSSTLMIVGGITLMALAIRLVVGKNWVIKLGKEFFIGNDLIKALENFLRDMPNPKSETTANLVGHIIYRFTRLGLIGLVIAIIPAWLLYQQNQLFGYQNERIDKQTTLIETQTGLLQSQDTRFERQNQLITSQNDFIKEQTGLLRSQDTKFGRQNEYILQQTDLLERQDRKFGIQNELLLAQNTLVDTQNYRLNLQNNLIEAERRSSLVFLMSNVLDKVDEEIREQKKDIQDSLGSVPDSIGFSLSKPLVNRIVALSRAFRPYRVLEGDTLSEQLVSPERGQLFIALMENNLDSLTQNTIAESGDFSNAIVGRVDLREANLREANLIGTVRLYFTDLSRADLSGADLSGADLSGADLRRANLESVKVSTGRIKTVYSLQGVRNLHPDSIAILQSKYPCLFTVVGCF